MKFSKFQFEIALKIFLAVSFLVLLESEGFSFQPQSKPTKKKVNPSKQVKKSDLIKSKDSVVYLPPKIVVDEESADTFLPKKEEEIPVAPDVLPHFPGGDNAIVAFINSNLHYPQNAIDSGIEGKVFIEFVVGKDGSVKQAKVLKGVGGGCSEEALRVVRNMPLWKPGLKNGMPVLVTLNIPFNFQLK